MMYEKKKKKRKNSYDRESSVNGKNGNDLLACSGFQDERSESAFFRLRSPRAASIVGGGVTECSP